MGNDGQRHVALVTGGSRGIGAAIARQLARSGAAVVVAARGAEDRERLVAELEASGARAWSVELDVIDPESVVEGVRLARALSETAGPLDWLVNNAGIALSAPLLPKGPQGGVENTELFDRHLAVNLHGPRRLVEALAPGMKERSYGRIVNVASSAGLRGYSYVAGYCASKFALVGYTLAAAHELASAGITVDAVCPHYVDSPMLDASVERVVRATGKDPLEVRAFFRSENPGGELVTPDEVAAAVLDLLASDATGTLVELDGSGEPRVLTPNEPAR